MRTARPRRTRSAALTRILLRCRPQRRPPTRLAGPPLATRLCSAESASYKEKLLEEQRLAELERARDGATQSDGWWARCGTLTNTGLRAKGRAHAAGAGTPAAEDVRKKGDLTSFYRNLLGVGEVLGDDRVVVRQHEAPRSFLGLHLLVDADPERDHRGVGRI